MRHSSAQTQLSQTKYESDVSLTIKYIIICTEKIAYIEIQLAPTVEAVTALKNGKLMLGLVHYIWRLKVKKGLKQ